MFTLPSLRGVAGLQTHSSLPKGYSTYDSFNMVVAGVKGNLVEGISLIYDTLMAPSLDEMASEYGLIAEAAHYPADFSWVSFRLGPRPDGTTQTHLPRGRDLFF